MSSPEVRAHSAIHVLKGAVTKVLGPRRFVFGEEGVLRFKSEEPPTSQELGRIGAAANRKIAEDAEVLEFEMDRQEAEGHFGTGIYDLSPAPAAGEHLRIVRIHDWEASCCPHAHVEGTGSIGAIRIDGAMFDGAAKEVVIRFHLL
ncbi:MAG: alanyl-tRNA editing protein [Thaumarchaeota archaeon]|nr:alanyl-tRNA editing protein [Nitrososphaerota archaeon]